MSCIFCLFTDSGWFPGRLFKVSGEEHTAIVGSFSLTERAEGMKFPLIFHDWISAALSLSHVLWRLIDAGGGGSQNTNEWWVKVWLAVLTNSSDTTDFNTSFSSVMGVFCAFPTCRSVS